MGAAATIDTAREVTRRGCLTVSELRALGGDPGPAAPGVQRHGDLFVSDERWSQWVAALREIVREQRLREPLRPGVAVGEVVTVLALRASSLTRIDVAPLVQALASEGGLELERGVIREPGSAPDLGPAEAGLVALEQRLAERPFRAPERGELADLGLGPRQLAAAVALGRLVDLGDNIVLTPVAPAQAMRLIAALPQPFSTAQAREALGTTRRVAIPLLEHLDARGWTRRIDAGHREVVRTRTETR